jgi:hypothetical protein
MKFDDFVDSLYEAGWRNPNDAQCTNIRALWKKLFPAYAELDEMRQQLYKAEDVLHTIGNLAHDASGSCAEPFKDTYWEIRNMAYNWEKQQ